MSAAMRRAAPAAAIGALALLAGCAPGIRWRGFTYEPVAAASREENKLTFVYVRSWYLVECTNFEEQVLKDPRVLQATAALNCVALDYDADKALADGWGVAQPPAFLIVGPDGRVLSSGGGKIDADALLAAIRTAQAAQAASATTATAPASAPAKSSDPKAP